MLHLPRHAEGIGYGSRWEHAEGVSEGGKSVEASSNAVEGHRAQSRVIKRRHQSRENTGYFGRLREFTRGHGRSWAPVARAEVGAVAEEQLGDLEAPRGRAVNERKGGRGCE